MKKKTTQGHIDCTWDPRVVPSGPGGGGVLAAACKTWRKREGVVMKGHGEERLRSWRNNARQVAGPGHRQEAYLLCSF